MSVSLRDLFTLNQPCSLRTTVPDGQVVNPSMAGSFFVSLQHQPPVNDRRMDAWMDALPPSG